MAYAKIKRDGDLKLVLTPKETKILRDILGQFAPSTGDDVSYGVYAAISDAFYTAGRGNEIRQPASQV